jgi:hypothetical protein
MTDQIMLPWRKSIRSNASSGCVEVAWIDAVFIDRGEADARLPE